MWGLWTWFFGQSVDEASWYFYFQKHDQLILISLLGIAVLKTPMMGLYLHEFACTHKNVLKMSGASVSSEVGT